MFRNYLKVAIRKLLQNKSYVIINTLGMGIALACCVSAYMLVAFNIEFDDFFDDKTTSRYAKVMAHFQYQNGEEYKYMMAPTVMAPIAKEEISGIEGFTRYIRDGGYMSYEDKAFSEGFAFADSSFFELFEFPLKSGSVENFKNQYAVFLDQELAEKYFEDEDPINKTVTLEFRNKKYEMFVGGVFEKIPVNSSFHMQALIRTEIFLDIYDIKQNDWGQWRDAGTVFKMTEGADLEAISKQFDKYTPLRNEAKQDQEVTRYELLPFNLPIDEEEAGWSYMNVLISIVPLLVFITLASIILLIACFNLTNTTIALTVKRFKEIGVRKVVGARRYQLATQLSLEILITVMLSILVGLGMSQVIVPEFVNMWGLNYGIGDLDTLNLFALLILLLFVSAIIAGSYPALSNSGLNPVMLLKGSRKINGTNFLTRSLLVVQFSLSIIILIAGIIFTLNSRYQKKIDFGYNIYNVLTVTIQGPEEYNGLKNAISSNPKIQQVAVTDHHLGYFSYSNPVKIDTTEFNTQVYEVGANYFEVMGVSVVEGRDFIEGSELDFEKSAIVDERFVEFNNIDDPLETIIEFQGVRYNVIGVVKNHLKALWNTQAEDIGNFYRMAKPEQYHMLVASVENESDLVPTLKTVEEEWKKTFPGKPFLSRTQEDVVFQNANETNRNLTKIFLFLTVLGCLLSTSGIYSLASLNIEKRTKEIGIRKALGANIHNIIRLLNMEFIGIMLTAVVLGGLGGFFLTDLLLDEIYNRHIQVSFIVVLLCGLFVFAIGIFTTSGTIFRAAQTNPVDTLRSE